MHKPYHRLSEVNKKARKGICSLCGPVRLHRSIKYTTGNYRYRCYNAQLICQRPIARRYQRKLRASGARPDKKYARFKQSSCARCGFIPEHKCQLDVHHLDGNHKNNEISNLATLCANCHRLTSHAAAKRVLD